MSGARLVCGPQWGDAPHDGLAVGKEGAQAFCRMVLLPTSPSGPAHTEICSKPGNKPASLQIYHPSDIILSPLTHRLGVGGKHHHKARCRGTKPPCISFPSQPIAPKVSIPHLRLFPHVLCLAHFIHSSWQVIRSQEKGKPKPWVPGTDCHCPGSLRYPAPSSPALIWELTSIFIPPQVGCGVKVQKGKSCWNSFG